MEKWALPMGWGWRILAEVSDINPTRPRIVRSDGELTSFVPVQAVDEEQGTIAAMQARPYGDIKRGYTYFEEGDVLLAKITPSMENGKAAIATGLIDRFGFGTTEFHVFRPQAGIAPEWLFHFLRRQPFRAEAKASFRGAVGQQRVPEDFLVQYPIPIPYPNDPTRSLAEQRRIVARLEALLGEVRELRQLQAEIEADVGRLMEAVLAEVFGEIKSRHPGERPIHQLTSVTSGGTPLRSRSEYYEDGTIAWIKTGELRDNLVTEANEHITTLGLDNSSAKVFPVGTLLIAMYGQGQTRGRTGVLGIEAATNQACCAILPNPNEFESFYLQYWFRYMYQLLRAQTESHGGNQPNLSQTIIRELKPPLPNVEDQKHYVAHLKLIETEVDQLLGGQEHNNSLLDDLGQSILARAFLGEL